MIEASAPLRLDHLARVDTLLERLRVVLNDARETLTIEERRTFARETRKRVANTCAEVDWAVLRRLNTVDLAVLSALVELEPERGETFRTTGDEVWSLCKTHVSHSVVYVGLRRLTWLGLIGRQTANGRRGTLVWIDWDALKAAS